MADKPGYLDNSSWAQAHVQRLRAKTNKSNISKDDKLFLLLIDKPERTPVENRSLAALIRVERAKETMRAGRGAIREAASAKAKADRKARDHQRFLAAGLMTMVGLLDDKTGEPKWDRATLLGALDALAKVAATEDQQRRWKARGEALLAPATKDAGHVSKAPERLL